MTIQATIAGDRFCFLNLQANIAGDYVNLQATIAGDRFRRLLQVTIAGDDVDLQVNVDLQVTMWICR